MYRPRPQNTQNLTCDICGKPAKWYDRTFSTSYVLGEALCDECDARFCKTIGMTNSKTDNAQAKKVK